MGEEYKVQVRLFRFDPGSDPAPRYTEHALPYDEHTTVLDVLEFLHEQGEPFAFQRECRMFKCGSCAVKVNGRPYLACKQRVEALPDLAQLVIEPLTCFPLIKDLMVDFSADLAQRARLRPFPEAASAGLPSPSLTGAQGDRLREYTSCIRCACCVEACAAGAQTRQKSLNPLHLLDLARLADDPRDRADRLLAALSEGLNGCDSCCACTIACPVGLDVFRLSVGRLREMQATPA